MRFAKYWDFAKDGYYRIAHELGLTLDMIDKIEHDFCNDLVMKMFAILTTWMSDKRDYETLLNAANLITGTDHKHIFCRVSSISYRKLYYVTTKDYYSTSFCGHEFLQNMYTCTTEVVQA